MASDTQSSPSISLDEAIAQHLAGQRSTTALLRDLLGHPRWQIAPPPDSNGEPAAPHLVRLLPLDGEAAQADPASAEAAPPEEISGLVAFERALSVPDLAGIEIERSGRSALRLSGDDLPLVRRFVGAARIEALLRALDDLPDPFAALGAHDAFHVFVSGEGTGARLLLAPDRQGRQLAAAFTAEDACDAFASSVEGGLPGDAKLVTCTGRELFHLLKNLVLDGVVFNCRGPIAPVAFSADLFDLVLDA